MKSQLTELDLKLDSLSSVVKAVHADVKRLAGRPFLDEYHEPPEQLEALTQACGPLAKPLIQQLADARAAEVADGVRVHNYDLGALGVLVVAGHHVQLEHPASVRPTCLGHRMAGNPAPDR